VEDEGLEEVMVGGVVGVRLGFFFDNSFSGLATGIVFLGSG
jgi:hypothetical protein